GVNGRKRKQPPCQQRIIRHNFFYRQELRYKPGTTRDRFGRAIDRFVTAAYAESMSRPRLLFVTGKLAEPALRRLLDDLSGRAGFDYTLFVRPIPGVALAST